MICAREQNIQPRPVVSSSAPKSTLPRAPRPASKSEGSSAKKASQPARQTTRAGINGLRVRRLARSAEDGYRSNLVPGLKSSEDADRLALELVFATQRLLAMETAVTGLWAEVADATRDVEERTWLAFLIAYIGPHETEAPFSVIESVRRTWASGERPRWHGVEAGPRGAYDEAGADATVDAYRAWAQRAGSQSRAFTGEPGWTAERRFDRIDERLALPGLTRDARFELLSLLGRCGVYELRAGTLRLEGENEVTWAAKRAFGIGDPLLLEHRAAALAVACAVPLEALDLALHNWGSGLRIGEGFDVESEPDPALLAQVTGALGLPDRPHVLGPGPAEAPHRRQ